MKKIILHMDMDCFFAQIEMRENPRFKDKPVVVGADPKKGQGRGVVSTANYKAREYGINSATPISTAYKKCPDAVFVPVNLEYYKKVSQNILEIIKKYSDQYEPLSIDENYLDISFVSDYKKAKEIGKKLKKEILEKERLTTSVGIGPNKMLAKIASEEEKPDGLFVIKPKEVESFLKDKSIRIIPGIGPKTAQKLKQKFKLEKVGELKKIKKKELIELLGSRGKDIYKRARGIDNSPVKKEREIKSIGRENTFKENTREPEIILNTFNELIEEVYKNLKKEGLYFETVTVVCRVQNFQTYTRSHTINKPSNELETLRSESKKLLLKFLTQNLKPLRLIGVRVKVVEDD